MSLLCFFFLFLFICLLSSLHHVCVFLLSSLSVCVRPAALFLHLPTVLLFGALFFHSVYRCFLWFGAFFVLPTVGSASGWQIVVVPVGGKGEGVYSSRGDGNVHFLSLKPSNKSVELRHHTDRIV